GWRAVYLTLMVDPATTGSLEAFYLAEAQRLAHTGSWAFTAAGFTHWSPELFTIHGLAPPPDGRAPSIAEYLALVHPDDRAFVAQDIQQMLADHRGFDFTKRIVRPDGTIRHVRCVGVPAAHGEGFVGTGIDVTEQEQLTAALRKGEVELRQILDLAPQIIGVLGPRRERLYANRVALAYYGVTLEEWRQRSFGPEVHPDDFDRVKALVDRSVANPAAYEMEMRLRSGDGTYRWFLVRYNPLRDDQGQLIRWYLACTDIDDRRRTEDRMRNETIALREDLDRASMFEEIVGSSPALQRVLAQVAKVAQTDSTVLILGETGTGKELLARAIHKRSRRSSGAFIGVNCAAIPPSLIASELFGHEKGAFTGALQRRLGRFEAADGGTIFLDEIGDLPPEAQVSLLRVLQEREIERVGSSHPIPVDVRVIAATNSDLEAAVERAAFREDLFYRLNVFPIRLPPLRERADDIPILVEYLVDRYAKQVGKNIGTIAKQTLQLLQAYDWPGNVRELQNVIERAVVLSEGDTFAIDESWLARKQSKAPSATSVTTLAHGEKALIEAALKESEGRVAGPRGAAAKLGIPRQTLEWKIRNLNIDKLAFRNR
ncbi:MAG TPA: sigma 54-interacting transcriptional regulator, partial [Gemmatimonadales bacterium]|nr:sigma 54-interacting transcriptional regulator [Gemmatimonadales bacterium]